MYVKTHELFYTVCVKLVCSSPVMREKERSRERSRERSERERERERERESEREREIEREREGGFKFSLKRFPTQIPLNRKRKS